VERGRRHRPDHHLRIDVALEAVIFDLWGTLVPYPVADMRRVLDGMAEIVAAPREAFAAAWGSEFSSRATGSPLEQSLRQICDGLSVDAPASAITDALAFRLAAQHELFQPGLDAVPTLEQLAGRGLKLGLITDCTADVPDLWGASALAPLVDAAVFSAVEGMHKPDRRMYELACERLAVSAESCLYVGDGGSDELNGAVAAGMQAVQLRPGDTDAPLWDVAWIDGLDAVVELVDARRAVECDRHSD
jgi:putative hydrolase of the HAD superfamily